MDLMGSVETANNLILPANKLISVVGALINPHPNPLPNLGEGAKVAPSQKFCHAHGLNPSPPGEKMAPKGVR